MALFDPDNSAGEVASVLLDAEQAADRVLCAHSGSAPARFVNALVAKIRGQFDAELTQLKAAIAANRGYAPACAEMGMAMALSGRAEEALQPIERALRLDPQSFIRSYWEYYMCVAYAHLGRWEETARWCERSIASNPEYTGPYVALAATCSWLGRSADGANAVAEFAKRRPDTTVQGIRAWLASPDPKVTMARERVIEGLRRVRLPEQ